MKHLKLYKIFESELDKKGSDRDFTNHYYTQSGWIRYNSLHKDSYINIEKYFDIDYDHLSYILEDLVETCDLIYVCSVRDDRGLDLSHEDAAHDDNITVDLLPRNSRVKNYKTYMSRFSHFPPRETDVLYQLLQGVENKLSDFHLTIKDEDGKWNFFLTSSQIQLKIKRK